LSNSISAVVRPTCERIGAEVQEACSAAVLDGQDIVMVTHASPPRFIAVGPGVGFRLPAFCTSLGRVLLAALPDDALDAYLERLDAPALTEYTVTDKTELRDAIVKARKQGFSFADQEAEIGFRSVSVPLRRYDGATVAALNVGARIERASVETMLGTYLPLLRQAADELRRQLI
jgi:IclR family pca regulon transcriptional regulator